MSRVGLISVGVSRYPLSINMNCIESGVCNHFNTLASWYLTLEISQQHAALIVSTCLRRILTHREITDSKH